MLVTRNFGDWHTVVGEVPWISMAKATMDCQSNLVLHFLRNNQLVQVIIHQPRQTTLVLPGPCDQTCCSILNMLQLVNDLLRCGRQNRVTIVDAHCDKGWTNVITDSSPGSDEHISAAEARRNMSCRHFYLQLLLCNRRKKLLNLAK